MTDYKNSIASSFLYKYRYIIGYTALALLFILAIFLIAFLVPGGLSNDEINSVIKSSKDNFLNVKGLMAIDAPYRLLQILSIRLFGLSTLSIKLPSLLLALLTLIIIFMLVKEWYGEKIAIISAVITSTCSYFLFIAQCGTPNIVYLLLPMTALLIGTYIIKEAKHINVLFLLLLIVIILSTSSPICIYILLPILAGVFIHPHLRYLFINKIYKQHHLAIIASTALAIILIAAHIIFTPSYILSFLDISSFNINLLDNLSKIYNSFLVFSTSSSSPILNPVIGLGPLVIIILGIYNQVRNHQSSISYILGFCAIFSLPFILISYKGFQDVYLIIAILLLSSGVDCLLNSWYKLFPKNPYARTLGLIFTLVLVGCLTITNLTAYVYGYMYNPTLVNQFSEDLNILPKNVKTILVSDSEYDFYSLLGKYNGYTVLDSITDMNLSTKKFVATRKVHRDFVGYDINNIITNDRMNHSNRFYIYQKSNY